MKKNFNEKKLFKKNLMAPFYGWGSTASGLEPLRGDSLLFSIKFPGILRTHSIKLRRMKGWVDLGASLSLPFFQGQWTELMYTYIYGYIFKGFGCLVD